MHYKQRRGPSVIPTVLTPRFNGALNPGALACDVIPTVSTPRFNGISAHWLCVLL